MKKLLAIPHIPENIAWAILTVPTMNKFEREYRYPFTDIGGQARLIEPSWTILKNPNGGHLFSNYNDARMVLEDSGMAAGKVVPVMFKKVTALSETMPASKLSEKHTGTRPIDFKVGDSVRVNIPDTVLQSGFDICPVTGEKYWIPDGIRRVQGCSMKVSASFNPGVKRYHLNLMGCHYQFLPNWLEKVEEKFVPFKVGDKVRVKYPEGYTVDKSVQCPITKSTNSIMDVMERFNGTVVTIREVTSSKQYRVQESKSYSWLHSWLEKVEEVTPAKSLWWTAGTKVRLKPTQRMEDDFARGCSHSLLHYGHGVWARIERSLWDRRHEILTINEVDVGQYYVRFGVKEQDYYLDRDWLEKVVVDTVPGEVSLPNSTVPCTLSVLGSGPYAAVNLDHTGKIG